MSLKTSLGIEVATLLTAGVLIHISDDQCLPFEYAITLGCVPDENQYNFVRSVLKGEHVATSEEHANNIDDMDIMVLPLLNRQLPAVGDVLTDLEIDRRLCASNPTSVYAEFVDRIVTPVGLTRDVGEYLEKTYAAIDHTIPVADLNDQGVDLGDGEIEDPFVYLEVDND